MYAADELVQYAVEFCLYYSFGTASAAFELWWSGYILSQFTCWKGI